MIPVLPPIRVYGQFERAKRVSKVVELCQEKEQPLDVVIMNEVIPPMIDTIVSEGMNKLGFIHRTDPFKDIMTERGGIVVFSKHPIVQTKYTLYGKACSGADCLSAKGIVYTRIKKDDMLFNIFATHMQAWPGIKSQFVRHDQIKQMLKFVQSMKIPFHEPTFLCGDLNMDLYTDNSHFKHLMYRLGFDIPVVHEDSHPFTFDAQHNQMVGNDEPGSYENEDYPNGCVDEYYKTKYCPCCPNEWLDYILISKNNLRPKESWIKSLPIKVEPFEIMFSILDKATIQDVSDHFPVFGSFTYEVDKELNNRNVEYETLDNYDIGKNQHTEQNVLFIILIVVACILVLAIITLGVMYIKKIKKNNKNIELYKGDKTKPKKKYVAFQE